MKDNALMAECGYAAYDEKMAGYSIDEITIRVNGTECVMPVSADCVCYDDTDGELKVVLNGINRITKDDESSADNSSAREAIYIKVYKEGVKSAVYDGYYTPEYNGDYAVVDVGADMGSPKPGRYLLTIENATIKTVAIGSVVSAYAGVRPIQGVGCCSFGFSVLPAGADMEHALPKGMEAVLDDSEDVRRLVLTVGLSADVTWQDRYEICCISPLLMPSVVYRLDTNGGSTAVARVEFHRCWTDGCYSCVLLHNGEPFSMVKVDIAGGKVTGCGAFETVDPSMTEYLLATHCTPSSSLYDMMSVEGCEALKHLCLDVYRASIHNRYRERARVSDIRLDTHFCFYSTGAQRDMEIIKLFAAAAFPLKSVETLDLSEIMSPYLTTDPADLVKEKLDNRTHFVIVHHAGSLMWGNGKRIANIVEQKLKESEAPTLAFYGSRSEMERLAEMFPSLFALIPSAYRVGFGTLDSLEALHGIENSLERRQLVLSANARKSIAAGLERRMAAGSMADAGIGFGDMFVDKVLMPRFTKRLYADVNGRSSADSTFLTTVKSADIDWQGIDGITTPLEKCLEETNAMVGLKSVKETVTSIAMKARFENLRRRQGLAVPSSASHHMIFTGNPGTGKTTIAKKLGKIFRSLGILSKGDVVVAERSTMVGRFIGQTEQNMQVLLEQAQGNVLFIDEAYTLCDTVDDRKDFGYRALECLLTVLSQKSPDMVVVMAGYEKDMDRMLDANQGMRGRFPYRLHFDDYTTDELVEIGKRYIIANGLSITEGAVGKLHDIVDEETANRKRDFSNARWMEQLIDNNLIPVLSERALKEANKAVAVPTQITEEDMFRVKERLPKKKVEKTIGF